MFQTGAITSAEYNVAVAERKLKLKPGKLYQRIREPYFFSYVYNELVKEYGAATVRSGGLRVYTTVDRRLQIAAQRAIQDTLPYKDDPPSAVVSIDPNNGAIRAMVAVTPEREEEPVQPRLAGAAAGGLDVQDVRADRGGRARREPGHDVLPLGARSPYQPDPLTEPWEVETYSNSLPRLDVDHPRDAQLGQHGVRAADARRRPGERCGGRAQDGRDRAARTRSCRRWGSARSRVSPLEMASAYATLAAGGIYSEPMAIRKVVLPDGKEDDETDWGKPKRKRVLADWVAYEVTKILEDNVYSGTGVGAQIGRPAAGKTGTTDNHADAWFAGFTPQLETVVWVGYPQAQIPMENVHGISVAGGTFPADIWRRFMLVAMEHRAVFEWKQPNHSPEWRPFEQGQYALEYVRQPRAGGARHDDDRARASARGAAARDDRASAGDDRTPPAADRAAAAAADRARACPITA